MGRGATWMLALVALLAASCSSGDSTDGDDATERGPLLVLAAASEQAATYTSPFAGNQVAGLDPCAVIGAQLASTVLGEELLGSTPTPIGAVAACTVGDAAQIVATFEDPANRGALASVLPGRTTGSAYGDVLAEAEILGVSLLDGPWDAAFVSEDEPVEDSAYVAVAVGDYLARLAVTDVAASAEELEALAVATARALGGRETADGSGTTTSTEMPMASDTTMAPGPDAGDGATGGTGPETTTTLVAELWCVTGVDTALNVRATPAGELVTGLAEGRCDVRLVAGTDPVETSGHTWVTIEAGTITGWVSNRYLTPAG